MYLIGQDDGGMAFRDVPEGLYRQLVLLSRVCDPESCPDAVRRLHPSPVAIDMVSEELREEIEQDWEAYVRPQLDAVRQEAVAFVMKDLNESTRDEDEDGDQVRHFQVPAAHIEAWCHALNTARVVMSEKYRLPLSEYPREKGESVAVARLAAARLCDVYAELLECLVRAISSRLGGGFYGDTFEDC